MNPNLLDKLRCPLSGQPLKDQGASLITEDGQHRYRVTRSGIPLFAEKYCSVDAKRQQDHYESVAAQYIENLGYPHTQEYMTYLDRVIKEQTSTLDLKEAAEICCGRGELLGLFGVDAVSGVGVDISLSMLESARTKHDKAHQFTFVQGDATCLPLASNQFSSAFMLGGIHHVPNRRELFLEVFRILRPGGRFYWREPVSDFFLWRWLRAVIYRISPALDSRTERPLLYKEMILPLEEAGFKLKVWKTYGFLGFCLFMNSDVLVFNRLFRFIPGIRALTRMAIFLDDITVRLPGLRHAGLQVVGVAEKPMSVSQ